MIIPTCGADDYLRACVASVAANTDVRHRIVVVDAAARRKRPRLPAKVQWVAPERRLNFAEAVNRGVRASSSPFLCMLNDDTIVTRGWIRPLLERVRRTGGLCNPLSNCERGSVHDYDLHIGGAPLLPGAHVLRNGAIHRRDGPSSERIAIEDVYAYAPGYRRVRERDWLALYCTVMARSTYERIGPLDEAFGMTCEDIDYSYRAHGLGIPRTIDERSFVFHFGGISRSASFDERAAKARLRLKYGEPLVVIHAEVAIESWTASNVERPGIGGSETAVVQMAAELRKRGHRVVVFAPTGREDQTFGGVDYLDVDRFESFRDVNHADVLVASRNVRVFDGPVRATRRYLWVHDRIARGANDHGEDRVRRHYAALDAIFCLSPWHRREFARHHGVPTKKIVVTRNGIDPERFRARVKRQRNRLIYSSSPDRGLDVLLRLFPHIRAELPDAELHVFYGFDNVDTILRHRPNPERRAWRDAVVRALAQPGVFWHGRVGQRRLALEMLASDVWLYPTEFTETYCITALEAQMAGVVCICSDVGALRTTVGDRGILLGRPGGPAFERRAVRETIALLRDRPRRRRMAAEARRWAAQQTWASLAEEWIRWFRT